MTHSRITHKTVTFVHPFMLKGFDTVFPAGNYVIDTTEELIEGLSFTAYRRVATELHYRTKTGVPFVEKTFTINPDALESALALDIPSAGNPQRQATIGDM